MLVGDFTEEYEIFVFEQAMHAVGHTVHVVCPDRKAGENIKTSLHDFEGDQTYTEKYGHLYTLNKTFSEAKPADYDAVYIAGGRGPEYIRIDPRVQAIVRHFHESQKPIFTICHGVQVLIAVDGVVKGKRVAGLAFLRTGSASGGRHLCRCRADGGLRRWHTGFGQGLDRACGVHARMPQGARHEDRAWCDHAGKDGRQSIAHRGRVISRFFSLARDLTRASRVFIVEYHEASLYFSGAGKSGHRHGKGARRLKRRCALGLR